MQLRATSADARCGSAVDRFRHEEVRLVHWYAAFVSLISSAPRRFAVGLVGALLVRSAPADQAADDDERRAGFGCC